jgi:hypothetical protein
LIGLTSPKKITYRLSLLLRDVDTVFPKDSDDMGIEGSWGQTSAFDIELLTGYLPEVFFRQLAPGRVVDADKQHPRTKIEVFFFCVARNGSLGRFAEGEPPLEALAVVGATLASRNGGPISVAVCRVFTLAVLEDPLPQILDRWFLDQRVVYKLSLTILLEEPCFF